MVGLEGVPDHIAIDFYVWGSSMCTKVCKKGDIMVVKSVDLGLSDILKAINSCILVCRDGIGKLDMLESN
jgi:hypothetical protein